MNTQTYPQTVVSLVQHEERDTRRWHTTHPRMSSALTDRSHVLDLQKG